MTKKLTAYQREVLKITAEDSQQVAKHREEPVSFLAVMDQISRLSSLGFYNTTIIFPTRAKAEKVAKRLLKKGYHIFVSPWSDGGFAVEVEW